MCVCVCVCVLVVLPSPLPRGSSLLSKVVGRNIEEPLRVQHAAVAHVTAVCLHKLVEEDTPEGQEGHVIASKVTHTHTHRKEENPKKHTHTHTHTHFGRGRCMKSTDEGCTWTSSPVRIDCVCLGEFVVSVECPENFLIIT